MTIKCGACKLLHESVDEVKECFTEQYMQRAETQVPKRTMHAVCEDTRVRYKPITASERTIVTGAGANSINAELQAIVIFPIKEEHDEPLPHNTKVNLTESEHLELCQAKLDRTDAREGTSVCIGEGMHWTEELAVANADDLKPLCGCKVTAECQCAPASKPVKLHPADASRMERLFQTFAGRNKRS